MKSDGQQKQPLIPPQEYGWRRWQGGVGGTREGSRRRRGREGEGKQENSRTKQAATQQGGSFNKHELELGAIERYGRKAYANERRPNEEKRERREAGWGEGGGGGESDLSVRDGV